MQVVLKDKGGIKNCVCQQCICIDCKDGEGTTGGHGTTGKCWNCQSKSCYSNCPQEEESTCKICICVVCSNIRNEGALSRAAEAFEDQEIHSSFDDTSAMDADRKLAEGGMSLTDPPPFEPLQRIKCNCAKCQCIICTEMEIGSGLTEHAPDLAIPPIEVPARTTCICDSCNYIFCHENGKTATMKAVSTQYGTAANVTNYTFSESKRGQAIRAIASRADGARPEALQSTDIMAEHESEYNDSECQCQSCLDHNVKSRIDMALIQNIHKVNKENRECKGLIEEVKRTLQKMIEVVTAQLARRRTKIFGEALDVSVRIPHHGDQSEDVTSGNRLVTSSQVLYAPPEAIDGGTVAYDLKQAAFNRGVGPRKENMKKNERKNFGCEKSVGDCEGPRVQTVQKEEEILQNLVDFEMTNITSITGNSLIVEWSTSKNRQVHGYEIFVNGSLATKVANASRTRAMMPSLDLSRGAHIVIYH